MKKILLGTAVIAILGIGIFAYGNKPQKTYYANGTLKSEVEQSFFKKNGIYKEYDENSKLKLEVAYQDDKKNGLQKEYFIDGSRLESHFIDGQKTGQTTFFLSPEEEYSWYYRNGEVFGHYKLFDNIKGTIDDKGHFVYPLSDDLSGTITGRFVCPEEKLIQVLRQKELAQKRIELAKCIVIEHIDIKETGSDETTALTMDGAFQFPKFIEQTSIRISSNQPVIQEIYEDDVISKSLAEYNITSDDLQYYIPNQIHLIVQEDNQHVQIEYLNKKQQKISDMQFDLSDIALLIDGISQISGVSSGTSQQKLFETIKKITFNQFNLLTPDGQKDIQFKGIIHLLTGQATTGSRLDIFNSDEKSIFGLETEEEGVSISLSYPMSAQRMMSFDVVVDSPYLKKIQAMLEKAPSFEAYIMTVLTQSEATPAMLENIVQKILIRNLVLNDVNGHQIISAQNLTIDPKEQQIVGRVQFNKTPQEYAIIYFTGERDTVQIEKSSGEKINTSIHDLPLALDDYITDDLQKNTWGAFLLQAEQIGQSEKISFIRQFYRGFSHGISQVNQNNQKELN